MISPDPSRLLAELYRSLGSGSRRMGKVAIIRDMAAVTCVKPVAVRFSYLTDLL